MSRAQKYKDDAVYKIIMKQIQQVVKEDDLAAAKDKLLTVYAGINEIRGDLELRLVLSDAADKAMEKRQKRIDKREEERNRQSLYYKSMLVENLNQTETLSARRNRLAHPLRPMRLTDDE